MIVLVPREIEIPDSIYIDGEQLVAEVHNTPYGGLTDVVYYESEDGHNHIDVKLEEQSVYVRYNGQSHTEQFGDIRDLVEYLMRSCDIVKSTKKSKSFSDMVKEQRMKNKGIKKELQSHTNGTFYVDVEKTDGEGRTLGGIYVGRVADSDEAVNIVVDSLDKCGTNLVIDNGFSVSKYGNLGEYIKNVAEYMRDVPDISEPLEEVINFQINVSIKIGKK